MIKENFVKLYEKSLRENWDLPALTNYNSGTTYLYSEVAKRVAKVQMILDRLGLRDEDKVAIVGKDSAEWCMAYLGIITYGTVVVPILPDFSTKDIHNIINHSDATVVFASEGHLEALRSEELPAVRAVYDINTLDPDPERTPEEPIRAYSVHAAFDEKYASGFTPKEVRFKSILNDAVALISYTSGTTGRSKGVVLTANNLAGNVVFTRNEHIMRRGESILCFLPLAHMYSCSINFLAPLTIGVHVYILGKAPTATILMKALADVRPVLIISVPLIFEKLYKSTIQPLLKKDRKIRLMLKLPILAWVVRKKIRKKLYTALGGSARQIIIGGSAMSEEVDKFLTDIKFPYTVGYGMTECGPLISYSYYKRYIPGSCGRVLKGYMEARISPTPDSPDPTQGEIEVRGENVCLGYYKNEEATRDLFTADGWMRTGDLGEMDAEGNIFIKGRRKSMILSSSGQNIYPEEIESKLGLLPYIEDCLVVQQQGSTALVALVYPDYKALQADGATTPEAIQQKLEEVRKELNDHLGKYEQVARIQVMDKEFEKTPKKSIKRFLYTSD